MSYAAMGDGESPVSIEQLLHQRKVAFARWSFAKDWASYRGVEFMLADGPDEDEIALDGFVYVSLEAVFEHIDTFMGGDDEEELATACSLAWEEWRDSDEAKMVHVGQHRLDGES